MSGDDSSNLAVLIDADNVSYKIIAGLMAEVANYGNASVRRIYGDWTSPLMKGWRESLLEHSVHPMQQFAYTTGKNATDGAMIIDAMDLMYTGRFSGFCLVSSDSDFTRLASRIREQGITVYGFGKRNTNNAFVVACNKFVYFDALPMAVSGTEEAGQTVLTSETVLSKTKDPQPQVDHNLAPRSARAVAPPISKSSLQHRTSPPDLPSHFGGRSLDQVALTALRSAIQTSTPYEDDYVNLAEVGTKLQRISPDLNPGNYGYIRLRDFVEASGIADVQMKSRPPAPPIALVRLK